MYISSEVAERIKITARDMKISVKKLLEDAGLGFNTMSNMKTSMPKADNLAKIADCLNVSVDYLIGRTENKNLATGSDEIFTEHEKNFVIAYRNKPEMQAAVDRLLGIDAPQGINIGADIAETVKKTQRSADIKSVSHSK